MRMEIYLITINIIINNTTKLFWDIMQSIVRQSVPCWDGLAWLKNCSRLQSMQSVQVQTRLAWHRRTVVDCRRIGLLAALCNLRVNMSLTFFRVKIGK
jgi:hypothetical protein